MINPRESVSLLATEKRKETLSGTEEKMELGTVTTTTITHRHLPWRSNDSRRYLAGNAVRRISLPLHRNVASLCLQPRTGKFQGEETVSEEKSTAGVNEFGVVEKRDDDDADVVPAVQDNNDDQTQQALEFLNDFKLDSDNNTYSVLLYGSGAVVALYLTCAIVASLESIPLLPKLMEVVGLGYTLWFTTRYLLFKRNREELKTKISEIKKQVLGSDSD